MNETMLANCPAGAVNASGYMAPVDGIGAQISVYSTAPYVNPREGRCVANDNTCKAYAKKDSLSGLCAGHSKSETAD
jgi:hypothetical protein